MYLHLCYDLNDILDMSILCNIDHISKYKQALKLHIFEDQSLGEIAEMEKTSRQAVHDTVRRAILALDSYEESLKLLKEKEKLQSRLTLLDQWVQSESTTDIKKAKSLLKEMQNELGGHDGTI